jgi:phthalate 4,5-dioxygenase oxygenase subunit
MRPARVDTAKAAETHWLRPSTDKNPRIQVQLTNYGMRYAAIRRPITNANTHHYLRVTVYVVPFTALIPPNASYNVASVIVPKDDTSSYFNFIAWSEKAEGMIDQEGWRKFLHTQVGIDLDDQYRLRTRSLDNNFGQDRQWMKLGHFTGIPGIPNQDIAMWLSMSAIADRTSERLGASDIAVVQFRRLMIDAARSFMAGGNPIGLMEPHIPQAKLRSAQGVFSKTVSWRTLGASDEEISYLEGIEEDETEQEMSRAARA